MGSLDFCLPIWWLDVLTIKQAQLTTISQAGAWGNAEKPRDDMVFLLIAPSVTARCERIFGLVAVWVHPHQVCLAYPSGGDPMPSFTGWQRSALATCLCLHEHCHPAHTTIQQGTPQHPDEMWASKEPFWLPPPVASMEATTMQGEGGLPSRTECRAWHFSLWLCRAAALGCGYHGWSHPKPC